MFIKRKSVQYRYLARGGDWQLVHGNLMTILMIFFMVLFSLYYVSKKSESEKVISNIQAQFGGKFNKNLIKRAQYKEKEEEVAKEFDDSEGLKRFTRIETDREKIKIIFPNPVIFSAGSADLKPDTMWILSEVATRLKMLPENEIIIEGHTDNVPVNAGGSFSSNWELSLARSLSIVHYLTEVEGVDPKRIIPIGYGEHRPLFPNDTPMHRAQNRRIEISIIKRG